MLSQVPTALLNAVQCIALICIDLPVDTFLKRFGHAEDCAEWGA